MILQMIPISERLPELDQAVIAFNGKQLVASKYVQTNHYATNTDPTVKPEGMFQIEKYHTNGDRSYIAYWVTETITHWMPAIIETV